GGRLLVKSGIMLGLGETPDELRATMRDLVAAGCDILTLGQYLRPTLQHLPVRRYVPPAEFEQYRIEGLEMGFRHVESGPLVRSSYHARGQVVDARAGAGGGGRPPVARPQAGGPGSAEAGPQPGAVGGGVRREKQEGEASDLGTHTSGADSSHA
ncbi:MAG TPA: hypothetical protein VF170_05370, partial [Planctomycetaceae bacterium]